MKAKTLRKKNMKFREEERKEDKKEESQNI